MCVRVRAQKDESKLEFNCVSPDAIHGSHVDDMYSILLLPLLIFRDVKPTVTEKVFDHLPFTGSISVRELCVAQALGVPSSGVFDRNKTSLDDIT